MQPLQENVKKELIKHPFRNIEIVYEEGKTAMTEQDAELLAAYIRIHDSELELKNTAETLYKESIPVKKTIAGLREELKNVKATFDICCQLADKLSDTSYMTAETSLHKLAEKRGSVENKLREYNEKILEIYETTKVLQEKVIEYHEASENRTEVLYSEFVDLSATHIANWENNALNSVVFDGHFDKFREYTTEIENQREVLIAECEEAMTNYTTLNLETSAVYNVWNEFVKRYDLLTTISDLQNRATGFTEN